MHSLIMICFFVFFMALTERGAARLAHYLGVVGVAGSNPAVPTEKKSLCVHRDFFLFYYTVIITEAVEAYLQELSSSAADPHEVLDR